MAEIGSNPLCAIDFETASPPAPTPATSRLELADSSPARKAQVRQRETELELTS